MRFFVGIGCMLFPMILLGQPYLHPLAEQVEEGEVHYFLNEDGEVIPKGIDYARKREAKRKRKRKPFEVKEFYADGQLALHTYMEEPDPVSTQYTKSYVSYYDSGDTSAYYEYKRNLKDGVYRLFHDNGELKEAGSFDAGKKEGAYSLYDQKGQLMEQGNYDHGKLNGLYTEYYSDGSIKQKTGYYHGTPLGAAKAFHPSGSVASMGLYDRGQLNGTFESYYPTGGKQEEGRYEHGVKIGTWITYHSNGAISYRRNYQSGNLVGEVLEGTENGDTLTFGVLSEGRFTGETKAYASTGKLVFEKVYANGTNTSMKIFNPDGSNRRVGKMTDKGLVFKCLDRSGKEQDCSFSEFSSPHGENIKLKVAGELPVNGVANYTPRGVYRFTVNRRGQVSEVEVVDATNAKYDRAAIKTIKNQSWNPGLFYGLTADYSNHIAIEFRSGRPQIEIGEFYMNDSALIKGEHVPAYRSVMDENDHSTIFSGGEKALAEHLKSNTTYPASASDENHNGTVMTRFIIEPSGVISNPSVVSGVYPSLNYEAIRVVEKMPLWIAGSKDGWKNRVIYNLPFRFTLQ